MNRAELSSDEFYDSVRMFCLDPLKKKDQLKKEWKNAGRREEGRREGEQRSGKKRK